MTTATALAFPIDDLLICAKCDSRIELTQHPEPRYACRNSCTSTFAAGALNRKLIPEITAVVITDATFPSLRAHFARTLAEVENQDRQPPDDKIRRIVTDSETFLAVGAVPTAAELLAAFIDRVNLDTNRATIQYALPLPDGTILAGSRRQEIELPEWVTVQTCGVTIHRGH